MNKKIIFSAVALVLTAAVLIKSNSALAQGSTTQSTLVQRIAEKFSLKPEDVQAVFDQFRQERHAQRQSSFEAKLSQLVTDGKITEGQKQLILAKKKELQADRANWQNLSAEERKAKMQAQHQELKDWAKQNGVNL